MLTCRSPTLKSHSNIWLSSILFLTCFTCNNQACTSDTPSIITNKQRLCILLEKAHHQKTEPRFFPMIDHPPSFLLLCDHTQTDGICSFLRFYRRSPDDHPIVGSDRGATDRPLPPQSSPPPRPDAASPKHQNGTLTKQKQQRSTSETCAKYAKRWLFEHKEMKELTTFVTRVEERAIPKLEITPHTSNAMECTVVCQHDFGVMSQFFRQTKYRARRNSSFCSSYQEYNT